MNNQVFASVGINPLSLFFFFQIEKSVEIQKSILEKE